MRNDDLPRRRDLKKYLGEKAGSFALSDNLEDLARQTGTREGVRGLQLRDGFDRKPSSLWQKVPIAAQGVDLGMKRIIAIDERIRRKILSF